MGGILVELIRTRGSGVQGADAPFHQAQRWPIRPVKLPITR